MKKHRISIHLCYCLVILTLTIGLLSVNGLRISAKYRLKQNEEIHQETVLNAFKRLTEQMAGALHSIVEAETPKLYLIKLSQLQVTTGQALLLLSENGQQTPWIGFWQSMEAYLKREAEQVIDSDSINSHSKTWRELAELMDWLTENPSVLTDNSMNTLPDGLKIPTLQTAYEISEDKTLRIAERVFGAKGGLRLLENTPPGIRSYACNNGRADLLQSGELLYFTLKLSPKEGNVAEQRVKEIFLAFAQTNGFGELEIIDLYQEDNFYRGKLVPKIAAEQLGRIPDLDRTIEIACTAWSGKVCYFSAGKYYTASQSMTNGMLLSEKKIEELAMKKGARIGFPIRYMGKICRPLIYERGGISGHCVLCIDAVSGETVDLFYVARPVKGAKRLF